MLLVSMMSGVSVELITSPCGLSSWTSVAFLTGRQLDFKSECTIRTSWKCIAFLSSSFTNHIASLSLYFVWACSKGRDIHPSLPLLHGGLFSSHCKKNVWNEISTVATIFEKCSLPQKARTIFVLFMLRNICWRNGTQWSLWSLSFFSL